MRTFTCAAVMLLTAAASAPFGGAAFAQAGSTGGTLGNTDKSISGDREQPRETTTHPREKPKRGTAAASIGGKWTWTQKCDDGSEFTGSFSLVQNDDGTVSGTVTGTDGSGSIFGHLEGNKIVGSRTYNDHDTHIVLTFSGGGMNATENSKTHGACRYQAQRA
jgi:hypothetical protein